MLIRTQFLAFSMFSVLTLSGSGIVVGNDSEIDSWVTAALAQDQRVENIDVHVTTREGVVTLTGHVPTLAGKQFASEEASKINGVTDVVNQLAVAAEKRTDDEIESDIRRRIDHNASIITKGLKVACLNGFVTLSGEVADRTELVEAEDLSSEVRGVKQVVNRLIATRIRQQTDEQTERDVLATLVRDVYLNDSVVTASVKDGVVALSGTVGSAYAKQRAANEVQEMKAVKSVVNQLKVDPLVWRGERTASNLPRNEDLKSDIHSELAHDGRVDSETIKISVTDGHVDLSGHTRTHGQKQIAQHDVLSVVGVRSVDNHITVAASTRDDSQIAPDVILDLGSDALLDSFDIDAKSDDGVITLRGNVATVYQRAHAEDLAARVRGVASVDNRIVVDSKKKWSDDDVTKAITERWTQNQVTKQCKLIHAAVKSGVATLKGNVDSWAEYQEAARVAFHTHGVRHVKNQLVVEGFDYPWEQFRGEDGQDFDPSAPPIHQFLFD